MKRNSVHNVCWGGLSLVQRTVNRAGLQQFSKYLDFVKRNCLLSWNICSISECSKVYVGFTVPVNRSVFLVTTSTTIYQ